MIKPVTYRQHRKAKVFDLLGNKCVQCGERDVRVLQIDHVNSDGALERKLTRLQLYKKVEAEPHRYQLLCANDNWRKRERDYKVQKRTWKGRFLGRLGMSLLVGVMVSLAFVTLYIVRRLG